MTGEFDLQRYLRSVQDRTGLTVEQAQLAVEATFAAIGRGVRATIAGEIAAKLPEPLAVAVQRGAGEGQDPEVLDEVAQREHVSFGAAKEHAQVALEQLAPYYGEHERERLAELLPEPLDAWLVPWVLPQERRAHGPILRTRSLADGRPGSPTPLSEAGPDRGQHDSIAHADDPHADTRVSTTHGVSTERDASTLAEGKPGSRRPVSEGHD